MKVRSLRWHHFQLLFSFLLVETAWHEGRDPQPIRVFGVGLPRTGTTSLGAALNQLGYKTYHTTEVLRTHGHVDLWYQAATTGNISAIFDQLSLSGYNATTNMPIAGLYREALQRYPQTHFILTIRDSNKWAASMELLSTTARQFFDGVLGCFLHCRRLRMVVYWMQTTLPFLEPGECFFASGSNTKKCIESYEQHNQDVIDTIPQEQLLQFKVQDGYTPLCKFLKIPTHKCPETFPHLQNRAELQVMLAVGLTLRYGLWSLLFFFTYYLYVRLLQVTAKSKTKDLV